MRAAIETATGRLVELSSSSTVETLLTNALAAGFAPGSVTVLTVSDAQAATLLAQANAPLRMVRKSTIVARLIAAGVIDEAVAALQASPDLFARWTAPDKGEVLADDSDTVAFLTNLGLDPAAILAPDN